MDMREAYKAFHEASGIEAGDKVKIVRGYKQNEMGFAPDGLREQFNLLVGEIMTVQSVQPICISLDTPDHAYIAAPFFCLELIEKGLPPIKIGDNAVEFTDGGIKVGYQEVSAETIDKIHKRLHDREAL